MIKEWNKEPCKESFREACLESYKESINVSTNELMKVSSEVLKNDSTNESMKVSTKVSTEVSRNESVKVITKEPTKVTWNKSMNVTTKVPQKVTRNESVKVVTKEPTKVTTNESMKVSTKEFPGWQDTEFIRKLGQGNTGEVYLCQRRGTLMALKMGETKKVLLREAEVLQQLSEYNGFPKLYEVKEEKDRVFLWMEYVEGRNLEEVMRCYPEGMRQEEAEQIGKEILCELSALHQRKVPYVYRDLKPSNIMLTPKGQVRLIDFGAALQEGEEGQYLAGTYGYSSPEQFWPGAKIKCSADIYSFGKILFYLLTGKNPAIPPYKEAEDMEKDALVPARWKQFLTDCLQRDAQCRIPNAVLCLDRLENIPKKAGKRCREKLVYEKSIWVGNFQENL